MDASHLLFPPQTTEPPLQTPGEPTTLISTCGIGPPHTAAFSDILGRRIVGVTNAPLPDSGLLLLAFIIPTSSGLPRLHLVLNGTATVQVRGQMLSPGLPLFFSLVLGVPGLSLSLEVIVTVLLW